MKLATYGGIDYGVGTTANRGEKARYGIIPLRDLSEWTVEDILHGPHSTDVDFEEFIREVTEKACSGTSRWLDAGRSGTLSECLNDCLDDFIQSRAIDALAEDIEAGIDEAHALLPDEIKPVIQRCIAESSLGDYYEQPGDCTRVRYESPDIAGHTDSSGDFWVYKSPFVTWAQFCSPCALGAGYLRTPCVEGVGAYTYCPPTDWWPDGKCPYPYWNVDTGEKVFTPEEKEEV